MLQWVHSAIFSTFIKLPFAIKTFYFIIFEWPLKIGFTVHSIAAKCTYGTFSEISNTLFFPLSYKMFLIRAEIHKMLVRIANMQYPDQTASLIWVYAVLSQPFKCSKFFSIYH